jgi:RNA polymerase sigma factor (sigma-70 family)
MTALPDWDIASDAELVGAAATGDRAALGGIYDRYADRLHDFCIGMLRDREAAADCVQEVFCTAAVELTKLRDPDKLRPWLYAIARNEALRHIRRRRRESVSDELPEVQSSDAGPDTLAARTELASLIAEAAGGLSDRDRSVLELSYRHGLDGPELAEALGVSLSNATKLVSRLRDTVERSLGALLVARRAQRHPGGCAELTEILANWDGQFSVLMRKRIARHIDSCPSCDHNRRDLVNPKALLGVVPILVAAPWWLRGQTLSKVQLTSFDTPMATVTNGGSAFTAALGAFDSDALAGDTQGRHRRRMQVVAVLVAILIVALGLTFVWLHRQKMSIAPSDVIEIKPTPTETVVPSQPKSAPGDQPTASLPPNSGDPESTAPLSPGPEPNYTPTAEAPISSPPAATPAAPQQPSAGPVSVEPPVLVPPRLVPRRPPATSQAPTPTSRIPAPAPRVPDSGPIFPRMPTTLAPGIPPRGPKSSQLK